MNYQYHAPLDPECPEVREFYEGHEDDPISKMCGCMDEITGDFEGRHRRNCVRCQRYGAANIEIAD